MKFLRLTPLLAILLFTQCSSPKEKTAEAVDIPSTDYAPVYQVASGTPRTLMLTSYSTTMLANGKDQTRLKVTVTDSTGREIMSASDSVRIYVEGDGKVVDAKGNQLSTSVDTAGITYSNAKIQDGLADLMIVAGTKPGHLKVEAKMAGLWPASHEIHTIPGDVKNMKPTPDQLPETTKPIDRMIGADISFLPQNEARGAKYYEDGQEIDAVKLLHDHGMNYIRLRIFVNPENPKGYSPERGFCDLDHTLAMAKRVKDAGMKLLLDFHYSDYWADPQQQNKPLAWKDLDYETLKDSVQTYTTNVLNAMDAQGTMPDMVQVGNEINHGFLWPEGHIGNLDQLAGLLKAGVAGVEAADASIPIMMHLALGGQNEEAVFWLDNMLARGVKFDIIGLSYYPQWHGTLNDLQYNMNDLLERYHKPLNVVEYSNYKKEVHDISFALPNNMGKGACIWEPLGRGGMFERSGETTDMIMIYDQLADEYLTGTDK